MKKSEIKSVQPILLSGITDFFKRLLTHGAYTNIITLKQKITGIESF